MVFCYFCLVDSSVAFDAITYKVYAFMGRSYFLISNLSIIKLSISLYKLNAPYFLCNITLRKLLN